MFVNCITRNRKHPTLRAISVKYETKDKKKRARILWISRYYFYISVKVLKTHQSIRVKKIVLVPFEVKSRNPSEIYDKGYQLFYIYRSQWGIQKYDIISHTIGTQQSKQKAKLLSHTPPPHIHYSGIIFPGVLRAPLPRHSVEGYQFSSSNLISHSIQLIDWQQQVHLVFIYTSIYTYKYIFL